MATLVTIARTTRLRLRLDRTAIATVAEGGTSVDVEDPAIKRDMNRTVGRWVVLTDAVDDGQATSLVYNETGGTLAAGSLVYFSGYDEATGKRNIVLADADGATGIRQADGVLRAALDTATEGQVFSDYRLTSQDTSGGAEGDPVYLSATAGGWTRTKPTGADDLVQVVGHIAVVHASAGVVEINLDGSPEKIGTDQLQDDAVTEAKIAGLTATFAEVNELVDVTSLVNSTIAVAAEGGDSIDVTVTLKDAANAAVNEVRPVECWLSSSATTGAIYTDGGITVTASTGSILKEHTDDLIFKAVTDAAGVLVLNVAGAGDQNECFLWVAMPNGKCKVSGTINLA